MTAVRDVELAEPLAPVPVPPTANRCFLIFRWHGRVIGRAYANSANGAVTTDAIRPLLAQIDLSIAREAFLDRLVGYDDRPVRGAPKRTATVAICTRERAVDLARALDAVRHQRYVPTEVLVVDNAPETNATEQLVSRFNGVRYVREERRGLDVARNRALLEAHGEIVAFTDDDAVPEPEWLGALLLNFDDPDVIVTTGLVLPLELETEAQEQFEQHSSFIKGFRRRVFDGQRHNPLAVGAVGAGASMAVRRAPVLALKGFDDRLDAGMPTRSGGDHDLFARVLMAGHRIVYEPAAVSRHRHRRSRAELRSTVYGYGVGVYAMWTGFAVERHEVGLARLAWQWFRHAHLPALLRPRARYQRALAWTELRGCLNGPRSWFAARRLREQEL